MPATVDKMRIGRDNDKRIKLTDSQRDELISMKGIVSQRVCANMFGVSRRLVAFLWNPEKLEENKKRRQERGGSAVYYDKEKHREYMRNHRQHKKNIFFEKSC